MSIPPRKRSSFQAHHRFGLYSEVMYCNLTKGLEPVSFLNLIYTPYDEPRGPRTPGGSMRRTRTIQAGSWANRFPGNPRVKLDYSRFISFYDEGMFPSLHANRTGLERWDHRLQAISKEDVETLFATLDNIFSTDSMDPRSRIDWQTLLHVVTDRYAERLELLAYLLNCTISDTPPDKVLQKAHRYVSSMLMPYTLYDVVPPRNHTGIGSHSWATPVFKQCPSITSIPSSIPSTTFQFAAIVYISRRYLFPSPPLEAASIAAPLYRLPATFTTVGDDHLVPSITLASSITVPLYRLPATSTAAVFVPSVASEVTSDIHIRRPQLGFFHWS